jgi:hypothetical protein
MQNTASENSAGFLPAKHYMLALLHAPQTRPNIITRATERLIVGKKLTTINNFQAGGYSGRPGFCPKCERYKGRGSTDRLRHDAKSELLTLAKAASRKIELRPDTLKKTFPSAMRLASPSSMALRSAESSASCRCSSRSRVRKAARMTSLAFL